MTVLFKTNRVPYRREIKKRKIVYFSNAYNKCTKVPRNCLFLSAEFPPAANMSNE